VGVDLVGPPCQQDLDVSLDPQERDKDSGDGEIVDMNPTAGSALEAHAERPDKGIRIHDE
jgi:hypothetical protein